MTGVQTCALPIYQTRVIAGPAPNDARQIQISKRGVATALVAIPLRYMHTNIETISPIDLHFAFKLLVESIESLSPAFPLDL